MKRLGAMLISMIVTIAAMSVGPIDILPPLVEVSESAPDRLLDRLPDRLPDPNEYHFDVLAGIQDNPADPEQNPKEIRLTCGWHTVCWAQGNPPVFESDGPGIDMAAAVGSPVHAVFRHVRGGMPLRVKVHYDYAASCRKAYADVSVSSNMPIAIVRFTHTVPQNGADEFTFDLATAPKGAISSMQVGQIAKPLRVVNGLTRADLDARDITIDTDNQRRTFAYDKQNRKIFRVERGQVYEASIPLIDAGVTVSDLSASGLEPDDDGIVWNSDNHPIYRVVGTRVLKLDRTAAILFDGLGCLTTGAHLHQQTTLPERNDYPYKNQGAGAGFPGAREYHSGPGRCFWSDTWIWKIKSSTATPQASDRAVDGAGNNNNTCPAKALTVKYLDTEGSVSISPPPLEPPSDDDPSLKYRHGADVTLTASPSSAYYVQWTGQGIPDGIDDKARSIVATMDADRTIHANFVPHGTLANLGIAFDNSISVQFKSRHAVRFELYKSSGSICSPGTSGCTLAATVTKGAVATDAKRNASFGDHPSGKYWVRGQYCASGSASAPGVATDACGAWSVLSGPHEYTASTATVTPAQKHRLTVRANPSSCGSATGTGDYAGGASVPIEASAGTGCRFKNWTGAGIANASSSSTTVTMGAADKTVTANFERIKYTLTIGISPSGCGSATGAGDYAGGASVPIGATASTGCRFKNWTGSGIANASSSSTTVTMGNASKTVTANFTRIKYPLTINISPSGCGSATGAGDYAGGTPVPISASAGTGCRFDKWTGAGIATASSSSTTVTMGNAPKTVTANFVQEHTLTVRIVPVSCKRSVSNDGITRDKGSTASFGMSWKANCRFVGWSSGVTNIETDIPNRTSTGKIVMSSDRTVTATLAPLYVLTVRANPPSCGTVSGAGAYPSGTPVTIGASANRGCRFNKWTGAGIANVSSSSTTVTMGAAPRTVTAQFASTTCTLTVRVRPPGGGTTTPAAGTRTYYDCPRSVNLKATANAGYRFVRWDGASGTSASTSVAMRPGDRKTVTARFAKQCTLTVTAGPGGTVRGGGTFDCYAWRTVRAIPNDYHYLKRWVGDSRTSSSLRVYLFRDTTLRAVFDHVCNHPVYGVFCPVAGAEDESGAEP